MTCYHHFRNMVSQVLNMHWMSNFEDESKELQKSNYSNIQWLKHWTVMMQHSEPITKWQPNTFPSRQMHTNFREKLKMESIRLICFAQALDHAHMLRLYTVNVLHYLLGEPAKSLPGTKLPLLVKSRMQTWPQLRPSWPCHDRCFKSLAAYPQLKMQNAWRDTYTIGQ